MNLRFSISLFVAIAGLSISSCQKVDKPVTLPEKGTSQHNTIEMDEDFTEQFFYNIEDGKVVYTSFVNSWDLAFESSPAGYHIFMNGAKNVYVYNTHSQNIYDVNEPPKIAESEWGFDAPCGLPDSTGVGDWVSPGRISKNDVYIVRMPTPDGLKFNYYKLRMLSVSSTEYMISFADIKDPEVKTMTLPKDDNYNYTYFTFDSTGSVVQPEPPKNTWDIVFTRYRHIYHDYPGYENFPYTVTGVLSNPYLTEGVSDSTSGYENITLSYIAKAKFVKDRNVIGFDWKSYDRPSGKYTVNKNKSYIIKTQKNQFWKIHFTDYYNALGVRGSPSFEYERLQ